MWIQEDRGTSRDYFLVNSHLRTSTDSTCTYSPPAEKLKINAIDEGSMKKRVQLYCGKAFLA